MKKGFTLIELVAVILILGIILIMIMPNFNDTLKRTKEKLLKQAARNWGMENMTKDSSKKYVTIKELQNSGYLEDKAVKDIINKNDISTDTIICIRYKDNQFIYTYEGDNIEGEGKCKK